MDTKMLSKGERKEENIHIGKIVRATTVHLPKMVILCLIPQLSHSIGLYIHINDLMILLQLNDELHFPHFCKLPLLKMYFAKQLKP